MHSLIIICANIVMEISILRAWNESIICRYTVKKDMREIMLTLTENKRLVNQRMELQYQIISKTVELYRVT